MLHYAGTLLIFSMPQKFYGIHYECLSSKLGDNA